MPSEWPEKGKRWTICETCWSVFAPDDEEACECDLIGESEKSRRIEVTPASRLEAAEQEKTDFEVFAAKQINELHADRGQAYEAVVELDSAAHREKDRAEQAESQLHALRGVLEEIAAGSIVDRLHAESLARAALRGDDQTGGGKDDSQVPKSSGKKASGEGR